MQLMSPDLPMLSDGASFGHIVADKRASEHTEAGAWCC
jgi:hypothetical protein